MAPMARRAMRGPSAPAAPRSRGLIAETFARAKLAFRGGASRGDADDHAVVPAEELSAAMVELSDVAIAVTDDDSLGALFARQLASGLWNGDGDGDGALLMSTAKVLARAFAEGVDAAHPIFGAQIKKAIEAIVAQSSKIQGDAGERSARAAVLAAYLVATGKRQLEELRALAQHVAFTSIEPLLIGPREAASAKLAELFP
jgi:Ca-activated chloride channel family protein